jgi:hypothetical protein
MRTDRTVLATIISASDVLPSACALPRPSRPCRCEPQGKRANSGTRDRASAHIRWHYLRKPASPLLRIPFNSAARPVQFVLGVVGMSMRNGAQG